MSAMVYTERAAECHGVVRAVARWAAAQPDIAGVAVVGSWARDAARTESDLDLVILTVDQQRYLTDDGWMARAVGHHAEIVRTKVWGPVVERRVQMASGFEIELGFAPADWAGTDPVDAGTARVVRGGCRPLHDPSGAFARLITSVLAT